MKIYAKKYEEVLSDTENTNPDNVKGKSVMSPMVSLMNKCT